ncbi:unnamed protein product [Gulo gulo]|uniref:Uncharacterized protein n=1 Tax=Gulo gulo TaxID=48420 RepID=A0A9X9PWG1_GULGU|nr:unnamed protein product [Gulo gulo]
MQSSAPSHQPIWLLAVITEAPSRCPPFPVLCLGPEAKSSVGAPMSQDPLPAPPHRHPLLCPGENEGSAEPESPTVVSCSVRRTIKNNRHTATCPGPAAAAGRAEVAAWERKQFPGLVERNNSISEEQEPRLGLQSPSQ